MSIHPYVLAAIGGALIGISSTIMLATLGKITGISGIFASMTSRPFGDHGWKLAFVLGLLAGGVLLGQVTPSLFAYSLEAPLPLVIAAGLFVGFGTRLGSGCTSGHGVCGLPRLAKRSWIATMTFMLAGMLTVLVKGWL